MNLTGGNTLPGFGKRINWQLITLVGGLAVLISAGTLSGVFEREAPQATTTSTPNTVSRDLSPVSQATRSDETEIVYVVLASEQEADILRSVVSTEGAQYGLSRSSAGMHIVGIDTAEEEAQFNAQLNLAATEFMAHGIGMTVVDLREPPAATANDVMEGGYESHLVYVVATLAEKIALEQQFHETSHTTSDDTPRSVVVIDPYDVAGFQTLLGEQATAGAFDLVDTRP